VTRVGPGWITAGQLVREKVVSNVQPGPARAHDHERGSQISVHRTGDHAKQMHRIEIDLVPGAAAHPDAISAKGRVERTRARSLIVPNVKYEVVLNSVIVSTAKIDPDGSVGFGVVVPNATNLIFLDRISAGRADCPDSDTGIRVAGGAIDIGNPAFHVDDIAPDYSAEWTCRAGALDSNAYGINLIHVARGRVADEVIFDQQAGKDGGG
jgi:hypothetical protein